MTSWSMSGSGRVGVAKRKSDVHAIEREESYHSTAFHWETRLTTGSDVEQPKDGESNLEWCEATD
jgi:hypothetical protein